MDTPSVKLSSHLTLTACLSAGLTIVLSLAYIILSIAALIFRNNCSDGLVTNATGAEYFWKTVFSAYILNSDCEASQAALESVTNGITGEYTVFVLTTITLSVALLCVITAIVLITVLKDEGSTRYITYVVFTYIGSCVASLIVDLTTATHFGIDYSYLSSLLENVPAGAVANYKTEVLRQGAFFMMSIALKGYFALAINIILMILLIVYVAEHRQLVKNSEHSIHKLGVLNAFDKPRKTEDWATQPEPLFARGSHLNNVFITHDISPPRTPRRDVPRNDYNNSRGQVNNGFVNDASPPRTPRREPSRKENKNSDRGFVPSDSWHHSQVNPNYGSRPFSYLEDIRAVPSRPPPSPAVEEPWRREPWPPITTPPVPPPDYSPITGRRLKSALKPPYMYSGN